jgi:hypothetical protein
MTGDHESILNSPLNLFHSEKGRSIRVYPKMNRARAASWRHVRDKKSGLKTADES